MPVYAFKFISGKYHGGEFPIPDDGELLIGRSTDLDLVLVEDMVSRKHAKLVASGQQISLFDLGSTNGTFVNGEKIRRATLERHDRVLIGTSILKLIDMADVSIEANVDPEQVREMLQDIASRAPATSSMSGDLEEVPLPDLLQLFATNKKSGILVIEGQHSGRVFIKKGQVMHVGVTDDTGLRPMKALCRMVGWKRGSFRLEPYEDRTFPEPFAESTESILMEALRQLDELRRLMGDMPPMGSNLVVCVPMTPKLTDLKPDELDTLQAVMNFEDLRSIINKSDLTDLQATAALHRMLRDGYVEVE